jgi:cell division protein FtsL
MTDNFNQQLVNDIQKLESQIEEQRRLLREITEDENFLNNPEALLEKASERGLFLLQDQVDQIGRASCRERV